MKHRLLLLLIFKSCILCAQANVTVNLTMPAVALLDVLPNTTADVALTMVAPTEAGDALNTGNADSANWLTFSSAIASGFSRSIKGDVVGTLPAGVKLKLVVSPYTGSGQGCTGGNCAITSNLYLTNTATSFIDNIQGAYTGITYGVDGFKLTYSLVLDTYANIRSGTTSFTVRYTMVDN